VFLLGIGHVSNYFVFKAGRVSSEALSDPVLGAWPGDNEVILVK